MYIPLCNNYCYNGKSGFRMGNFDGFVMWWMT